MPAACGRPVRHGNVLRCRNVRQSDRRDDAIAVNVKTASAVPVQDLESLVMRRPVFARVAIIRLRVTGRSARVCARGGSARIVQPAMPPVDDRTSAAHPDAADTQRGRGLACDRELGISARCRALDDSVLRDNGQRTREPLAVVRLHRRGSAGRDMIP